MHFPILVERDTATALFTSLPFTVSGRYFHCFTASLAALLSNGLSAGHDQFSIPRPVLSGVQASWSC
jgi:hypothetical protein